MTSDFEALVKTQKGHLILGASVGNCVHVGGIVNFFRLAEAVGFETVFLGAAVPPERIIDAVNRLSPQVLGISYRLTPEVGEAVLKELFSLLGNRPNLILVFGGTPQMVESARRMGKFHFHFVGDEPLAEVRNVLFTIKGYGKTDDEKRTILQPSSFSDKLNLIAHDRERLYPPLLRHHFGQTTLEETISGVSKIAEAQILDIISVAPDQNAQQFFFRPHLMRPELDGAGGAPLRKPEDLRRIWKAAQRGNYPVLRIYSGTHDLMEWAEISLRELKNAWGAVPLFWYSELDGRSDRNLEEAISENLKAFRWYAEHGSALEVLEAHQWSLREAPDAVALAAAYLGAYNAKAQGVKKFIAQYMFNTPRYTSPIYDLAKMTAKLALLESLRSDDFNLYRQVRPGLTHFSSDLNTAKGQLASSVMNALGMRPHIIHVVSYTEASHAAGPDDVIESCSIIHGVLKNAALGMPDPLVDERISRIRKTLINETLLVLGTIYNIGKCLGAEDPFQDPKTLATVTGMGILDAPHLRGQPCASGQVETVPYEGGCRAIHCVDRKILPERERLIMVLDSDYALNLFGPSVKKLVQPLQNLDDWIHKTANQIMESLETP